MRREEKKGGIGTKLVLNVRLNKFTSVERQGDKAIRMMCVNYADSATPLPVGGPGGRTIAVPLSAASSSLPIMSAPAPSNSEGDGSPSQAACLQLGTAGSSTCDGTSSSRGPDSGTTPAESDVSHASRFSRTMCVGTYLIKTKTSRETDDVLAIIRSLSGLSSSSTTQ